ncbi:cytochrome P450 [Streptomyces sp. NPDC020412]|uniref:cytochrome P450 n=1 Tax=Streptomyces sp. NPDC020412 TaxID=3365073 RepID=UPI003798C7F8
MTSHAAQQPVSSPFSTAFLANPIDEFNRLRADGPVHQVTLPDGSLAWVVTRERDVRAGLVDERLSVSRAYAADNGYRGFALPPALDANLLNTDAADHLRLRRLVSKAFTARRTEQSRAGIAVTAELLADRIARNGGGDIVADFASPLSLRTIGDMFAVPEPDGQRFAAWVGAMVVPDHPAQVAEAVDHIHRFLIDLISIRRTQPGPDLLSDLIAVRDDEDQLSEDELISLAFLILVAGSENTAPVISNGMLTLLTAPQQADALRSDPALLRQGVEELLRYAHPNQMAIRRFAIADLQIAGTLIPRGATVLLCLTSAHRDPDRYPDPDRFDIHRTPVGHLALGHGMHYCLGAALARVQVEVATETLLRRFPGLRLATAASELRWRTSWRSRALAELPVRTS